MSWTLTTPATWTATRPEPPPATPADEMSFTLTATTIRPDRSACWTSVPARLTTFATSGLSLLIAGTPTVSIGCSEWSSVGAGPFVSVTRSITSAPFVLLSWKWSASMRFT